MPPALSVLLPRLAPPGTSATTTTLPTGSPEIDGICGGIPRATLTEITGPASSGLTSLSFSLLHQATASGECCAMVDAHDAFDPASAAAAGVELPRLLWVRCGGNVENALKACDLLVRAGGFGLVMLDLSDTSVRTAARIPLEAWFRLRHGAEQSGAALVVTGDRTHAKSCARLQLEVSQDQGLWSVKLRNRQQLRAAAFRVMR
jgi:hypothetical protein